MSISEDDHNYYSLDPHRQPSLPSDYEPSPVRYSHSTQNRASRTPEPTPNARYSIAQLPALAYTPSPRSGVKRSPLSTAFEQYASNASVNGFISEAPNDEYSSDPHDFYRRYRDPFGRGLGEPLGQADIVVAGKEEGMTTSKHPHRESPITARSNGTKLASRLYDHPVFRASPAALNNKGRSSQPKSNPSFTSPSRNRQTSLKELVNKFNQTPDELPPLPRKSTTHTALVASGAVPSNVPFPRGRTALQSKGSGARFVSQESSSGAEQLSRPSKIGQRRRRRDSGISPSPTSTQSSRSQVHDESVTSDCYPSHPLGHQTPKEEEASRRPLFGELLVLDTDRKDPGYGIPRPWRRRGSEGSMHSPNPMFSDYRHDQDLLISPTSWSPIFITSPEDIRSEKKSTLHSLGLHRRTRSDIANASKPNAPSTLGKHVLAMSPPQDRTPTITSPSTMKRNSQSRIPISTRRRSTTSESGHSATSTRPNSVISRTPTQRVQSPQGSSASVESLQHSASPSRTPRATPVKSSSRHNHGLTIQHVKPNSLHAIITATNTQKSPPLRGSRTRQPVSSASTAASRARTAERFGHSEKGSKSPRDKRPKKLPELGQVDFAARRQAISQAFTKSVQENERKEELEAERRLTSCMSIALQDGGKGDQSGELDEASGVSEFSGISEEQSNTEGAREGEAQAVEDVSQVPPKTERDLTINTAQLSERSVLDLSQEDSPTLGLDDQFITVDCSEGKDVTPPSDAEPLSAVTAGTNDTADTFFDNEPQEDEASPLEDHRSLLSHVMSMRESSPASRASMRQVVTTEGSDSDRDDEGSIHIMLRNTPVEAHTDGDNDLYGDLFKRTPPREKLETEAKTVPWNLSNVSGDYQSLDRDPEILMDKTDEHPPQTPGESAHTSYSTIVSTTVSSDTQQPWSPAPLSSPATDRSTLDSDTYSTINRILNHYHNPNVLSPDMRNDFQQQIMRQTPELAKQGGWDPKKVTQLYLQKFAHGRFAQPNTVPEPVSSPKHISQIPLSNQIEVDHTTTSSQEQLATTDQARVSLEAAGYGHGPQRASLNNADDWASVSPSIMDYMPHQAGVADSPEDSMPPPLPPKNGVKAAKKDRTLAVNGTNGISHSVIGSRPELPAIQGTGGALGLAINIESPHDADPSQLGKPPLLPGYAPPPPPDVAAQNRLSNELTQYQPIDRTHSRAKESDTTLPAVVSGETLHQLPTEDGPIVSPAFVVVPDGLTKANSPTPDQKRLTRRRHIIRELVDTEHSFGQDMKVVDDIYKGTSNVIIVPAEDVKVLFGNSDQIVAFSTNFLDALKQASKSVYVLPKSKRWRSKRSSVATSNSGDTEDQSSVNGPELTDDEKDRKTFIGEAFGHHMPQMEKVYAEYLKNHDAANQKLQALQKNSNVQIWLKECRAYALDLTTAWDLDSLLVKPVQRVLKYPLLLDQLLDATPESHPDYTALDIAARGMKGLSMRINEMKKRADLMEQVTNRKRKESDVRLFKGLINRTERLKQKVGTTDMYEDKEYSAVYQKFGTNFFQLQVVMRDVEMYTSDVQGFVTRFCDFVMAIEAYMDVGQTSYPETESKWRKFRLTSREITMTALTDHIAAVRKNVINPMTTLIQLHAKPQKFMQTRNKKLLDFVRYKAIKDRGDKPDKKLSDQADIFLAVNETLKEDLVKLFALSGKLIEACLSNFVQLQLQWQSIWKRKLCQAVDLHNVPGLSEIIESFSGDFAFTEAQVLSLGICNGSMLAEAVNLVSFLSPTTTLNDDMSSPMRPPTLDSARTRTFSQSSDQSPVLPQPDFGGRHSGGSFTFAPMPMSIDNQITPARPDFGDRGRASSNTSGTGHGMHEMPSTYYSYASSSALHSVRPSTSTSRSIEPSPSLPRLSVDTPAFNRLSDESANMARTSAPTTYYMAAQSNHPGASESSHRYSGAFHSAMPMSDSPRPSSPAESRGSKDFHVMFLAASVYEFNIDRLRKEAGYPYLTYVAGEIFDVVGEKGELWLAKNQDDATNTIGWIWTKHFAKLAS